MAKKVNDISVEEKLRALYDLQIIDSRLDEIKNTRGELPIEVEDLEVEIAGLEKRLEKFQVEHKDFQTDMAEKTESISQSKSLMEKYKSQQDNVRNNKEFESLGKEIEYQDLEIQLNEKKMREVQFKIDNKTESITELTEKIENLKKHLKFKKEELEDLVAETQKEEDFLTEKSKEYASKIDERLLGSYQRIRNNTPNGLAIVGLERGAPKGSFFTVPPQLQMEIAQRKKILIDEHSGKILVDEELVNEETEKMKEVIKF